MGSSAPTDLANWSDFGCQGLAVSCSALAPSYRHVFRNVRARMLSGGPENRLRLSRRPRGNSLHRSLFQTHSFGGLHDRMVSLFKFALSRDRAENPANTAEVTSGAELSPATPKRAQPQPPVEAPVDDAQLKDFPTQEFSYR